MWECNWYGDVHKTLVPCICILLYCAQQYHSLFSAHKYLRNLQERFVLYRYHMSNLCDLSVTFLRNYQVVSFAW